MPDWLAEAQRRLESGIDDAGSLALSPADVDLLLELARRAAHESGKRTNAPLASFLVGLAVGRSGTVTLEQAIEISLGGEVPH